MPAEALEAGVGYAQPSQSAPDKVTFDDAAASVMTDLTRVTSIIILRATPWTRRTGA